MPEERGLYPQMTVFDQLLYFGRLHGLDRASTSAPESGTVVCFHHRGQRPTRPCSRISRATRADVLRGISVNNAEGDRTIRAGRPVAIDIASVIDWALLGRGGQVVAGGWTDKVLKEGD
jgi:hypothetical protein